MTVSDLPRVLDIAAAVHPAFPEDEAVFAERLRLYPQGCRVFERAGVITGYVVSHPWTDGTPPALNSLLEAMPAAPSTYYIHDLALMPATRGSGAAQVIVAALFDHARRSGFATVSLVAVNNSTGFWRKHGFAVVREPANPGKIESYGSDARLMRASTS